MDLNRIKAELEKLNQSGTSNSYDDNGLFWKPEQGKQVVRFIPNPHSPDFPFVKLQLYYGIFGKTVVSPASFGNDDPVLDFARQLYNTKDPDKIAAAKKLFPTTRTFAPVLIKDQSGNIVQGPSWWNFGRTIYQEILGFIDDADYGDITNILSGRDVTIEYTLGPGKSEREQRFGATTMLRVKPNVTPAYTDDAMADKIANLKNISDVYTCPTFEEMEQMLRDYLSTDSENTDNGSVEKSIVPNAVTPESEDKDAITTRIKNATDELDDLFSNLDD